MLDPRVLEKDVDTLRVNYPPQKNNAIIITYSIQIYNGRCRKR